MAKEKTKSPTVKKTPTASEKKPKKPPRKPKTATHPPYFEMIKEALMTLKEKNGSSPYAIAKKIEEKHKPVLPENFRKTLSLQLKNSVSKGKLAKIRASYKLAETKTKTMMTRQRQQQKKTTRSSSSRKSKKTDKQEKATKPKKRKAKKPRQLKSIKSPGSRKVLKASAS